MFNRPVNTYMAHRLAVFIIIWMAVCYSSHVLSVEYKVAVRAHRGIDIAISQWKLTTDWLTANISEHTFVLNPVISLDDISRGVLLGEFDFVLTNPSSYVEIAELYGAKSLVTLNNKRANSAQVRFGSVIFTHVKNTGLIDIQSLKNKSLMVVSKPAFGGWRVAWLEMLEQNFNPIKGLGRLVYANSKTQQQVVFAVLNGEVDAGVVRTDLLERMESDGDIDLRYLRVINNKNEKDFPFFLSTKLYPEWSFSVMKNVPVDVAKEVKKILLNIPANSNAARQGNYMGWVPSLDYSRVVSLMKKLKVGTYAIEKYK